MRYRYTAQFEKSYHRLPQEVALAFENKLSQFLRSRHYPSLRTKVIQGTANPIIWEGSITMGYRFTYQIDNDGVVIFRNIGKHEILDRKKF